MIKALKYTREIAIAAATIMLLLFMHKCNQASKSDRINKELARQSDSLIAKVKADSSALKKVYVKYQQDSAQARQQVIKADSARYAAEVRLNASQSTILRLAAKVEQYRYENDSTTVLIPVSENYILGCDSLVVVAKDQQQQISEHQKAVDDLVDLMNYEIVLRDSLIEDGKRALLNLRADFNAQKHFFDLAVKNGKQHGRLLGGVGLMGNEVNPLWGGGVVIAYQNKNGKQYQIEADATQLGLLYQAKILITLIK